MENFEVKIVSTSRELTAKERIMMKDKSDCIKLDEATKKGDVIFTPDIYVTLDIHNEMAQDKDYRNYVIRATDGTKYVTGSESFFRSFSDIMDEITDGNIDEQWAIKVFSKPSKKYAGKSFITCSLA